MPNIPRMDILGNERALLIKRLGEAHEMLAKAHQTIIESNAKFFEILDSASKSQTHRINHGAPSLYSQNRFRSAEGVDGK